MFISLQKGNAEIEIKRQVKTVFNVLKKKFMLWILRAPVLKIT